MPPGVRVRFAPSPTGHLHVGNARTALFNWLYARGRDGAFILRIEDTDLERSTSRSEDGILEDLGWLGLNFDEGPGIGGRYAPYRQSERRQRYEAAALRLLESTDAYRCFCSVQELEQEREAQRGAGLPPRYAGKCRGVSTAESDRRAADESFVLRFRVTADRVAFDDLIRGRVEFPGAQIGDPVIVRADGTPTYNFAVVIDDLDMEITHVIRGEDHISNTPRQILLYRALGAAPPLFAHVSLVLGPDGSPLSKRHGASSVSDFREKGILPEALVNYLLLLGWAHPDGREVLAVDELIGAFSLERVGHAAAMFDMKKLAWLNAHYLRAATPARLASECRLALAAAGYVPQSAGSAALEDWIGRSLQTYAGQMETLVDAVAVVRPLFRFAEHLESEGGAAALGSLAAEPRALEVITKFAERTESLQPPRLTDREVFRTVAAEVGRAAGVKGRSLYHPIRVAVTGADAGPELDRVVPLIEEGSLLDLPGPLMGCALRAREVARRLSARSV